MAPAAVFVVQYVVEFQREASFVIQDFPGDRAIPNEDVAVHAADGVTSAGLLCED